jgi:hypothetical protein
MPSCPLPVKHIETLARRERRLKAAMSVGKGNRLTVCVEQVRTARLVILKSRRESLRYEPETTEKLRELQSINVEESHWADLSIEEIIRYYEFHKT